MFSFMQQGELFAAGYELLSDEQVAEILLRAVASGGRLSRAAELHLNGLCVEHLVAELRAANLDIARRLPLRLHE